jgi:hypothetical protein
MSRIAWDEVGSRFYEVGVDRGVLFVDDQDGVPWNGLTTVSEIPSGGAANSFYLDGIKYVSYSMAEEFKGTLKAYTYPPEFSPCDGSIQIAPGLSIEHQPRKQFTLSYRTLIGNDVAGNEYGYKIHVIYNVLAEPSDRDARSLSGEKNVSDFSWDLTAVPIDIPGFRNSAHFIVDTTLADPGAVSDIEDILYGNDSDQSRAPSIPEMVDLMGFYEGFSVIDNGDGTFTITGPDAYVSLLDSDTFQLNWPSAILFDDGTFRVSSL